MFNKLSLDNIGQRGLIRIIVIDHLRHGLGECVGGAPRLNSSLCGKFSANIVSVIEGDHNFRDNSLK